MKRVKTAVDKRGDDLHYPPLRWDKGSVSRILLYIPLYIAFNFFPSMFNY